MQHAILGVANEVPRESPKKIARLRTRAVMFFIGNLLTRRLSSRLDIIRPATALTAMTPRPIHLYRRWFSGGLLGQSGGDQSKAARRGVGGG